VVITAEGDFLGLCDQ